MPVYEILYYTASKSLLDSRAALKPVFEEVAKAKGWLAGYYGLQEEDKKTARIFICWETYQDHKNLIDDKEKYPIIGEKLGPTVGGGGLKMTHVEFVKDAAAALGAPTTEILEMSLKDGYTKEDLDNVCNTLISKIEADSRSFAPAVWGPELEDANNFWLLLGWKSSKDHTDVVGQKSFEEPLQALRKVANLKMAHASLVNDREL